MSELFKAETVNPHGWQDNHDSICNVNYKEVSYPTQMNHFYQ